MQYDKIGIKVVCFMEWGVRWVRTFVTICYSIPQYRSLSEKEQMSINHFWNNSNSNTMIIIYKLFPVGFNNSCVVSERQGMSDIACVTLLDTYSNNLSHNIDMYIKKKIENTMPRRIFPLRGDLCSISQQGFMISSCINVNLNPLISYILNFRLKKTISQVVYR